MQRRNPYEDKSCPRLLTEKRNGEIRLQPWQTLVLQEQKD